MKLVAPGSSGNPTQSLAAKPTGRTPLGEGVTLATLVSSKSLRHKS